MQLCWEPARRFRQRCERFERFELPDLDISILKISSTHVFGLKASTIDSSPYRAYINLYTIVGIFQYRSANSFGKIQRWEMFTSLSSTFKLTDHKLQEYHDQLISFNIFRYLQQR
jgi:hypothetical protein